MIELNTIHGLIEVESDYWGELEFPISPGVSVRLVVPDWDDSTLLMEGCSVKLPSRYGGSDAATIREVIRVASFAADVAEMIDHYSTDAIAEAKKAEAEAEAERVRLQAERDQTLEDRKLMMMSELLGERVKIRERGYKTMRQAVVEVHPVTEWKGMKLVETGEYRIYFNYTGQDSRTQNVERIQRLDVKVGGSWHGVWDDGVEDMSPWDRELATSAAPPKQKYDGGLA